MLFLRKASTFILGIIGATVAATNEDNLNDILLSKALPLEEYEKQVIASGGEPFLQKLHRELGNKYYAGDDGKGNNNAADGDDDYFAYSKKSLKLNGYALQYTTCQKVQRYSVEAVQRGEYSSMVTDNVVILRLCPKRSCDYSSKYGCSSNYGEYAMDVNEYMTILMKYQSDRQSNFCSFCEMCDATNDLNNVYDDDAYANQTKASAYQSSGNKKTYYKYTSDGQMQIYDSNMCYAYSNKCKNVISSCSNNYDDDSSQLTDYLGYLDYVGCQKHASNNNNHYYWVAPHCSKTDNTIELGIFYDNTCNQDASDDIDVTSVLDDDFDSSVFSSALSMVGCLDCSNSRYPPYFNSGNLFCNNIYFNSGQCNWNLPYDLTDDDDTYSNEVVDDKAQCAFIESINYGTYDTSGEIYTSMFQTNSASRTVTGGQKIALALLSILAVSLAVYACFLHHEMTNLLLKSLSSGLIQGSRKKKWIKRNRSEDSDFTFESETTGSTYA